MKQVRSLGDVPAFLCLNLGMENNYEKSDKKFLVKDFILEFFVAIYFTHNFLSKDLLTTNKLTKKIFEQSALIQNKL